MKFLKILALTVAALCVVQLLYFFWRTAQAVVFEISRTSQAAHDWLPKGVDQGHSNLRLLRGLPGGPQLITTDMIMYACGGNDPDLDNDNDGLTGAEEFWLLTSDEFADSDNDGETDPEDPCPNCFTISHLDDLRSFVANDILKLGGGPSLFYVATPREAQIESKQTGVTVVSVSASELDFLREGTDLFPRESNPNVGHMQVTDRLFIPGFLYVGDLDYWCGRLCGAGNTYFVLDLAILGPTTIWIGNRWIS